MASRPVVPQPARGEAVVGAGNKQQQQPQPPPQPQQKKNGVAPEGRDRRALGDIGNLVPVRGIDSKQISRPITRSFCAQLLANAQAAAVAENNKKKVCVNVDAAAKRPAAAKPPQKKVVAKPKSEEVIEISSDKEEAKVINKQEKAANKKKEKEGSSRKNSRSLTSVLTARSKAACGITKKPVEKIVDIDAADADNELAVVEYVEDLYKFYKEVENESRPGDYMPSQPEINEHMRAILVDWLVEVHYKFELMPETLYLTVSIIDRFLSVKRTPRRELQLLGIGAMLVASKYEEIWAPEVNDLVCIADRAYSNEQILLMEKTILAKLEWTLTLPTLYVFIVRFIKASLADQEMENMVYFLAELGLLQYAALSYRPSVVAASAVYAARCTLNKSPAWNDTLRLHTGFSETEIMECAILLVRSHSKAAESTSKLKVVYKKYSCPQRGAVAMLPPAKTLLPGPVTKTSCS